MVQAPTQSEVNSNVDIDADRRAYAAITPQPIDLPPVRFAGSAVRGARVLAASLRYFAPAAARGLTRRDAQAARQGRRMFEALGATYMKFGQFVASAPGLVGENIAAEFRSCLDTGPAVPFGAVRATIESELGRPLSACYSRFEESPAAAASMAVVHRAWLHDGTPVAVKVLRPGIEQTVATDLQMMERTARFLAARGVEQGWNMVSLIVGLRAQVAEELHLLNEAAAMDGFRGLLQPFELSLLLG